MVFKHRVALMKPTEGPRQRVDSYRLQLLTTEESRLLFPSSPEIEGFYFIYLFVPQKRVQMSPS